MYSAGRERQESDPAGGGLFSPRQVRKELAANLCRAVWYSPSACILFLHFFIVLAFSSLFLSPDKGFLAYAWRENRESLYRETGMFSYLS